PIVAATVPAVFLGATLGKRPENPVRGPLLTVADNPDAARHRPPPPARRQWANDRGGHGGGRNPSPPLCGACPPAGAREAGRTAGRVARARPAASSRPAAAATTTSVGQSKVYSFEDVRVARLSSPCSQEMASPSAFIGDSPLASTRYAAYPTPIPTAS